MAQQPQQHLSPLPPPQAARPQVLIEVTAAGQLSVQSNLPSPGAWPKILGLLLAAATQAHIQAVDEAQQAGQGSRIVMPQGVVVG